MTDVRTAADAVIARLPSDNGRYVVISRDKGQDGLTGTVGIDTINPVRFHMDRTAVAVMVSSLPVDTRPIESRPALEAEVTTMVDTMAERLAIAAGVRWDKVSEPTGNEIVDRETRGYWRLLARTALGL